LGVVCPSESKGPKAESDYDTANKYIKRKKVKCGIATSRPAHAFTKTSISLYTAGWSFIFRGKRGE